MGLFDGTALERPVVCEACGRPAEACVCPPPAQRRTPPAEQTLRLSIEKRKKGKTVTVVRGLVDEGDHLSEVLTLLKSRCGAGGTVQDGEVIVQGSQLDPIRKELASTGYRVKS